MDAQRCQVKCFGSLAQRRSLDTFLACASRDRPRTIGRTRACQFVAPRPRCRALPLVVATQAQPGPVRPLPPIRAAGACPLACFGGGWSSHSPSGPPAPGANGRVAGPQRKSLREGPLRYTLAASPTWVRSRRSMADCLCCAHMWSGDSCKVCAHASGTEDRPEMG